MILVMFFVLNVLFDKSHIILDVIVQTHLVLVFFRADPMVMAAATTLKIRIIAKFK